MEDSTDSSERAVRNSVEQEETSTLMETGRTAQAWTDEQHYLFLKSMESTFVDQLYKSRDLSGRRSHKSCPASSRSLKHKQTSIRTPSGQFKVLRDGFWCKVHFSKDTPKEDQKEESEVPLANPWIQRYRNSKIWPSRKFQASCAKTPAKNLEKWCQDLNGGNTEVTDQNFNDEAMT